MSSQEVDNTSGQSSGHHPTHPKKHKRVVRVGTENFQGDGLVDYTFGSGADTSQQNKIADDDRRILSELPPHWGQFPAERD